MDLVIRRRDSASPGAQEVEVVERKGLGHPDTVCDALAEQICVRLCRHYQDRFGQILHHNVDKMLLVGGRSDASFGGGTVIEPIEIYIAGRVTREFRGSPIPADEIAVEACREWLRTHLRSLDVDRDIRIFPRLRPGSMELADVFARGGDLPRANDTACGVGFSPLTDLERVVLEVERTMNEQDTKRTHPEIGEDIKVMATRHGNVVDLTVGCAFVSRFIADADDYLRKKESAQALVVDAARRVTALDVRAIVNSADDVAKGKVFLTVTGTSAEAGDDGEAGRGNRSSGLITPYRPMTIESVAGKNPVSHVGKLYNLAARRIAAGITDDVPHVLDVECVLVSEIGRVISDPRFVDVRLGIDSDDAGETVTKQVSDIVRYELNHLADLRSAILAGQVALY
jgi:S-adenosylmethionine synthetase